MYKSKDLILSVVDQSPARKGGTGADALRESVRLAQICERLGYKRYWVAEHHNSNSWAGVSPEILIGQIAANTTTLRVGSGGVMLSHYSALKVAEQFRVLDAFYPGRIDLGIGRAPGSDQRTAAALVYPRPQSDIKKFPEQVMDLLAFLNSDLEEGHPFTGISALIGPEPITKPEVWLLGSSDFSARLSALLGLPFAFADFFGTLQHGPIVTELYRDEFQPSIYLESPKINVTAQVICAPDEKEAKRLSSSRNLNKFILQQGIDRHAVDVKLSGLLSPEEALAYPLSEIERVNISKLSENYIDGDPAQVLEGIVELANKYDTPEIGIVTNCYSFDHRVRSYELVAEAFNLPT